MTTFNFDDLYRLAQHDPENFEIKREELITNFIGTLPPGKRKSDLLIAQNKIDKRLEENKDNPCLSKISFTLL